MSELTLLDNMSSFSRDAGHCENKNGDGRGGEDPGGSGGAAGGGPSGGGGEESGVETREKSPLDRGGGGSGGVYSESISHLVPDGRARHSNARNSLTGQSHRMTT